MQIVKVVRPKGFGKGRHASAEARARVAELVGDAPHTHDLLVEHLHRIQDAEGCLRADMIAALAEAMRLSQAEVFEVASFYHHFDVVADDAIVPELTVRVCDSLSCAMHGAEGLADRLEARIGPGVRLQRVPCVGRCAQAPVAIVGRAPVERADVDAVVAVLESGVRECPLPAQPTPDSAPFARLAALIASEAPRTSAFELLERAGLRGLGGAGFPAARKWRAVAEQPGRRVLVVNADEGEPGTFKDRFILETHPDRFLEGMLTAAWAVDCDACYIYLRDEYAGIRRALTERLAVLSAATTAIAGWPVPRIHLRRGAGAYVCGEESGLIESLEGRRGMPRLRPPYVAEVGLFGLPTLAHNVETLYWVAEILARGAVWYASTGRRGRTGRRLFSVSGRVRDPGVKLADAGISLRELIDESCGGMLPGHTLKAYLPGGASGGILPAAAADEPLDFDTLQPWGAFIGSAAIIVLSQHDSVREAALNAMRFFRHESCGQCTPCRVGTAKATQLMLATQWDTELLESLSGAMADASICGLGQAAPNPVRTAIRYFPEELGLMAAGGPR